MATKETKTKVSNAFRAMKAIDISEDKVKPVLKYLLKLYDKNWALIEAENYRALADAIFEREEAEAEECSKKIRESEAAEASKKNVSSQKSLEETSQANEEPERPLKRLRLRYRDGQNSSTAPKTSSPKVLLVRPKDEPSELPDTCLPELNASQGMMESPQPNAENTSVDPQLLGKNKGKQPVSTKSLVSSELCEPCQPSGTDRSPSHTMRLRDRGAGTVSPQIPSVEKRSVPESSPRAACPKELKVVRGTFTSRKRKSNANHPLIIPKEEPVTDDMPNFAVPIAVIHPDPSKGGDSSDRNGTILEHDSIVPSVSPSLNEKERANGTTNQNEARKTDELSMTCGQCSSSLEIASSPSGEVKVSLNCDLALLRPDFHMPSLETVLKLVEEKYIRSYKSLDPNFSVMNIMKEMCQCFLNLRSGSNGEACATTDVVSTTDLLIKSPAIDALGARGMCSSSFTQSNDSQVDVEATLPKTSVVTPCDGIDDGSHPKKDGGDNCRMNTENNEICAEETNRLSLVVAHQPQVPPEMIMSLHNVVDIAKGLERVVITLVNEVNDECPPSFYYIPQNAVFQNALVNTSLGHIGNNNCCSTCFGDCLSSSTPCACVHDNGVEFAYTADGLVKEELLKQCISMIHDPKKQCHFFCKECPLERSKSEDDIIEPCKGHLMRKFIKECWWKCGCNKQCGNRVVQRGITRQLQVFMTPEGKGWGLRTLEDLPKGAFVCEYVGEVLTNTELFVRVLRSSKGKKYSHPVFLDADWGAKGVLKDEEAICLDATYCGNVARFINHRCYDSNLVEIPVEVETPDHHYYHLAFFTTREVKAMEELNWDYGIDFDDHDQPIKAFNCQCGSKFCRNIKRSRPRAARR